jgi:hypothetical protein
VDPKSADRNCGGCGIVCDPSVGNGTLADNTYFGCAKSECGHLKCADPYADCDKNLENGCETSTLTETDCGACGRACAPGQTCRRNNPGMTECICPPGQTLCGNNCVDIRVDPSNCGGCGLTCNATGSYKNGVGVCNYGSCTFTCMQGWGDCNGNPKDGCEVNLNSDQRNCGACGRGCDALAGQPCIAGPCAIHPCGEGEFAR